MLAVLLLWTCGSGLRGDGHNGMIKEIGKYPMSFIQKSLSPILNFGM